MTLKNIFNNASLEFLLQVPHACDLCNPEHSTRGSSSFQLTSLKQRLCPVAVGEIYVQERGQKKTGLCGKNSQVADPPRHPSLGNPCYQKKVGFIFHFRTSGTFLVFTKKSQFWPQRKQLRWEQVTPPPFCWESFPHIPVFLHDKWHVRLVGSLKIKIKCPN